MSFERSAYFEKGRNKWVTGICMVEEGNHFRLCDVTHAYIHYLIFCFSFEHFIDFYVENS